jgi:CelD/BcsL family acetyltransferase involved in cellulose biosynthesis
VGAQTELELRTVCGIVGYWGFSSQDLDDATFETSVRRDTNIYKTFLIAVAQTKAIEQLKVFTLKVNDEIISARLSRISKRRVENVISTFSPAYSKYGPGQLLLEDILKWAFERRLDCDLRLGDQPHKQSWANSTSQATTYQFINSLRGAAFSAAGAAYLQWRTWLWHLRQTM